MKVYIEAGANDGVFQSRTLKYKGQEGWKGILIEPDPRCHDDLLRNRFDAHTSIWNVALVPDTHAEDFIKFNQHHASAMNSVDGCSARGEKFQNTIEVEAMPLSRILRVLNVTVVDELYLDVEGFEAQVLEGIATGTVIKWAEIELHMHDTHAAALEESNVIRAAGRLNMKLIDVNRNEGHPKMIFIENDAVA